MWTAWLDYLHNNCHGHYANILDLLWPLCEGIDPCFIAEAVTNKNSKYVE